MSGDTLFQNCPSCGGGLMPGAVICTSCGQRVDHVTGASPPPGGFQAPPQQEYVHQAQVMPQTPVYSDLTKEAATKAEAFATEADSVIPIIFVSCLIGPLWVVTMPYYAWRLFAWRNLNNQYNELRFANSESPYGHIAVKFQAAWTQLLIGFIAGAAIWVVSFLFFAFFIVLVIIGSL